MQFQTQIKLSSHLGTTHTYTHTFLEQIWKNKVHLQVQNNLHLFRLMIIMSVCSKRKIHFGLVIFNINLGLQTFQRSFIKIGREKKWDTALLTILTSHNHGHKGKGGGWCYQLLIITMTNMSVYIVLKKQMFRKPLC